MEKLLKKAQELVVELGEEVSSAKKATAEANQTAADVRIKKKALDEKVADVKAREEAVAQSEGPIKAAEEARRIKTENAKEALLLEEKRANVANAQKSFRREQGIVRGELAKQEASNNAERDENRKIREDLKEREAKMEENILKKLAKG